MNDCAEGAEDRPVIRCIEIPSDSREERPAVCLLHPC